MSEAMLGKRIAEKEAEVNEVERRLKSVKEKIEASSRRLLKRPAANGDQLRAEVKAIDNKLTTTSMKLVEEKTLLRRKDSIKARLREVAGFEARVQELQALKGQRAALVAERDDKAAQLTEMKQGFGRLRLAGSLGLAVRDLVQESIEVPRDAIGRVIGKNRAAIKQLEAECKVSVTEDIVRFESIVPPPPRQHGGRTPGPNTAASAAAALAGCSGGTTLVLILYGTHDGVTEARRRLNLTIRTTEAVLEVPPPLAAALRASKRALLLRLESLHRVKIYVGPTVGGGGGSTSSGARKEGGGFFSRCGSRGGGSGEHEPRGGTTGGLAGTEATAAAVEVAIRGLPEDIKTARIDLEKYDCVETVIPVEKKSLRAIFGPGGSNLQQMESDYGVLLKVQAELPNVVLMGVRKDVEAAAERIRQISHEFRHTEERWPVEPYQVKFLLHKRGAELRAIAQRVGGGVILNIDRGRLLPVPSAASPPAGLKTPPAAEEDAGAGEGEGGAGSPDVSRQPPPLSSRETAAESQGQSSAITARDSSSCVVLVRGAAPRVSAASAVLLERLEVAERLTAKVSISVEAVPTFVGLGGSAIRKLRRLCVGCEVQLSPVATGRSVAPAGTAGGVAEVSLLAEDEAKLANALGLVERWIRHQQLRTITVGSEIARMLRAFRATGVREKITGAGRRREGGGEAVTGSEEDLFGGVQMDCSVAEGVVRLRGGDEELDRAERIIREFEVENWTMETPVAIDDEDVLLRQGLLRDIHGREPEVQFQYLRERRVVVVRGRQENAERAAALLYGAVHEGGFHGERQVAPLSVSLVPVAPSAMNLLTARGRFHLKRLSKETGAELDAIPSASVIRVRSRRPAATVTIAAAVSVAAAKRSLLAFVGSHRAEVIVDLAAVGFDSPSSPASFSCSPSSAPPSGGNGVTKKGPTPQQTMQAATGSDADDKGEVGGDGSGIGAPVAARKAVGAARSASNELIRRTVRLHGCEAEFVTGPPLPSPTHGEGSGSGDGGGGGGAHRNADRNAAGKPTAGVDRRYASSSQGNRSRRQDAGRGGNGSGAAAAVADSGGHGRQPRGISIRGPPGLVEKARNAVVGLVLGREEREVVLGKGAAAVVFGEGNWRKIQESSGDVTITPDSSRCSFRICGPPAAVEACRKEMYAMLRTSFQGYFYEVPVPRRALGEVASLLSLADAAAATAALQGGKETTAEAIEALGPVGAAATAEGWLGEAGVQLLVDWPCSCVRVRGDQPAVRGAVEAIHASLSRWLALEVTADVESCLVPALVGKHGKAIKKLSQSMGGVVLKVSDGVCSGRAASAEEAREATRKLQERVKELRAQRAVVKVSPEVARKLADRGGSSPQKPGERMHAIIDMEEGRGGAGETAKAAGVHITGDLAVIAAAKREVKGMTRELTKSQPAPQAHRNERNPPHAQLPRDTTGADPSSASLPSLPPTPPLLPLHPRQYAGDGPTAYVTGDTASPVKSNKVPMMIDEAAGAAAAGENSCRAAEVPARDAQEPPTARFFTQAAVGGGTAARPKSSGSKISQSPEHPPRRDASETGNSSGRDDSIFFGSFQTKMSKPRGGSSSSGGDGGGGGGDSMSGNGRGQARPAAAQETAAERPPLPHQVGGGSDHNGRVSEATESEAERLLAHLLFVENAPAGAAAATVAGGSTSSPRESEGFSLAPITTGASTGLRRMNECPGSSHRCHDPLLPTPPPCLALGRLGAGVHSSGPTAPSPCTATSPQALPAPHAEALAPACGAGYFTSSSGICVRL